eukprot:Skav207613  [mRNA]  locus=scaffold1878:90790:91396:+ [translate_table: standard]
MTYRFLTVPFRGSVAATTRRAAPATIQMPPAEKVKSLIEAKEVLKSTGSKFVVVELDELPAQEGAAMQDSWVGG